MESALIPYGKAIYTSAATSPDLGPTCPIPPTPIAVQPLGT